MYVSGHDGSPKTEVKEMTNDNVLPVSADAQTHRKTHIQTHTHTWACTCTHQIELEHLSDTGPVVKLKDEEGSGERSAIHLSRIAAHWF